MGLRGGTIISLLEVQTSDTSCDSSRGGASGWKGLRLDVSWSFVRRSFFEQIWPVGRATGSEIGVWPDRAQMKFFMAICLLVGWLVADVC